MSGRPILAALLCTTSLVAPVSAQKPRPTDFSGDWVWVESLVIGSTRSGETPAGGVRSSVNTSSGAAFNCGRECTILHKRDTLTVDNARLGGDAKQPSAKTPAVTFRIDGREVEVVDSFSPHRKLAAAAKWVGNQLEISSGSTPSFSPWTQTLSIEEGHLVVVHARTVNGERHQVRMKYRKK
jgi:hypothetical protein